MWKDIDKINFGAGGFIGEGEDQSIGMTRLLKIKMGFLVEQNAIIKYFNKIPVYPFNRETVLKDLFASDKFITEKHL